MKEKAKKKKTPLVVKAPVSRSEKRKAAYGRKK